MKNISYLLSLLLVFSYVSFADEEVKEAPKESEEVAEDVAEEAVDEDCLLYTSPSPRDMRRSRMPSSA